MSLEATLNPISLRILFAWHFVSSPAKEAYVKTEIAIETNIGNFTIPPSIPHRFHARMTNPFDLIAAHHLPDSSELS
jgi:hypothetical protein